MTKVKIVDHQITGNQKLAITRTKDRSLDSLVSLRDKRILAELDKQSDLLWQEAQHKRYEEKVNNPKELTGQELHKLKILKRKENRLNKEILMLMTREGFTKVIQNRRMKLNQTLKEIETLIKGTVYDNYV